MLYLNSPKSLILNNYTTVRARFEEDGSPIEIEGATFSIKKDTTQIDNIYFMYPVKENHPDIGYVQVAFDPTATFNGTPGDYELTFEAYRKGTTEKLSISNIVKFVSVTRKQWFIDQLRISLADNMLAQEFFPSRYLVWNPKELNWEDEELLSYLERAVGDTNFTPPPTVSFTLESVPCASMVVMGGMIYGLIARGLIEIYNYYEINAPVNVRIYKGDKLSSTAQQLINIYWQNLREWKKAFVYYTTSYRVLVLTKLPFRVIKPLSMMFGYHNFFTG